MENEQKVIDAMRKAGKPVRPGDVAKETGLESKEVSERSERRATKCEAFRLIGVSEANVIKT